MKPAERKKKKKNSQKIFIDFTTQTRILIGIYKWILSRIFSMFSPKADLKSNIIRLVTAFIF